MPQNSQGDKERNARIVMTYFHPWVGRVDDATEHVPLASKLRQQHAHWSTACLHWLDGRVLSAETVQYVKNFYTVSRARPQESVEGRDACSEDLVSDEELFVPVDRLEEALQTRVGGKAPGPDTDEEEQEAIRGEQRTRMHHHASSTCTMEVVGQVWQADVVSTGGCKYVQQRKVFRGRASVQTA